MIFRCSEPTALASSQEMILSRSVEIRRDAGQVVSGDAVTNIQKLVMPMPAHGQGRVHGFFWAL
jgi:hypothetical protein